MRRTSSVYTWSRVTLQNRTLNGTVPESVEDDGALVELVSRVQQLSGDDGGVPEAGRLAADLLAVQQDVLPVGSDGRRRECSQ